MPSNIKLIQRVAEGFVQAAGPVYLNTGFCNIEISKTKWLIEEMEDGSPYPKFRAFGERVPTVTYTMKNMSSIPSKVADSLFSQYNVRQKARLTDVPGAELRKRIIDGHEAIIKEYPIELKDRLQSGDITQSFYEDTLDDFNRIVPLVRKALVWKRGK